MSCVGLHDIAPRATPNVQGLLSYRWTPVLGDEKDSAGRSDGADAPGHFNAIELRKPDVQQDQVRLQFFSLADCFQSIRSFPDDLEFRIFPEERGNEVPPGLKVIDNKNSNRRQLLKRPPAWSKFITTPVTGGAELTVTGLLQRTALQSLLKRKPVFAVQQRGIRDARGWNAQSPCSRSRSG